MSRKVEFSTNLSFGIRNENKNEKWNMKSPLPILFRFFILFKSEIMNFQYKFAPRRVVFHTHTHTHTSKAEINFFTRL